MKIKYFPETDTLYIQLNDSDVVETKDLDDNTLIDIDKTGNICSITFEHAQQRTDINDFSFQKIVA